jgi:hypothetical protein
MRNEKLVMSDEDVNLSISKINSSKGNIRAELHRLSSTKAYKCKKCSSMRELNHKYLEMDQSTMYREIKAAELETLFGLPLNSVKASVFALLAKLKSDDQKKEVWEFTVRKVRELFPNQKWPTAQNIAHVIERKGYGKPPKEKVVNEEKVAMKIRQDIGLLSSHDCLSSIIKVAKKQLGKVGDSE